MTGPLALIGQLIDRRWRFLACGADFGSDAKVLALKGVYRLVWARPTHTLTGAVGCGHVDTPTTLQLRAFRPQRNGDGFEYESVSTLLSGGRLSRPRLRTLREILDPVFGEGATERLDPRKTLQIGDDVISAWLDRREKLIAETQATNALRELAQALDGENFEPRRDKARR